MKFYAVLALIFYLFTWTVLAVTDYRTDIRLGKVAHWYSNWYEVPLVVLAFAIPAYLGYVIGKG